MRLSEGRARLFHFNEKVKYLGLFRVDDLAVTDYIAAEHFPIAGSW